MTATAARSVQEQLFAERPVLFEGFLRFGAVRHDAFLVAFADHAQHTFFLVDVGEVEAGEFANAKTRGVEQFEQSAVAAEKQAFVLKFDKLIRRSILTLSGTLFRNLAAGA